jgi:hypothetical protein
MAHSKAAPALDMGRRVVGRSPGMREHARPSPGGALSPMQIERETRISNHIAPETGWAVWLRFRDFSTSRSKSTCYPSTSPRRLGPYQLPMQFLLV